MWNERLFLSVERMVIPYLKSKVFIVPERTGKKFYKETIL